MTKVTIFKQHGLYKGFEVSGHSGYADAGEDIVCAAISALTINCINSIETFTNDEFLLDTDEEAGLIRLIFSYKPGSKSELLIDSLALGFREIENENKEYITLDFKEV